MLKFHSSRITRMWNGKVCSRPFFFLSYLLLCSSLGPLFIAILNALNIHLHTPPSTFFYFPFISQVRNSFLKEKKKSEKPFHHSLLRTPQHCMESRIKSQVFNWKIFFYPFSTFLRHSPPYPPWLYII